MRYWMVLGYLLTIGGLAYAGSGTVNYNSTGSAAFGVTTDGSSNNYGNIAIVDGAAAANKATVNANLSLLIDANTSSQIHTDLTRTLADPCQAVTKITTAISQTSSGTIVTGTSAKKTYICGMLVTTASATGDIIAVTEGTGATCGTGSAALVGSTTVGNGVTISGGGGGIGFGDGSSSVVVAVGAAADNVCLLQNGSSRLSGYVTYVQQ